MKDDIFERWKKFITEAPEDWENTQPVEDAVSKGERVKRGPEAVETAEDIAREIAWALSKIKGAIGNMVRNNDIETLEQVRQYAYKTFDYAQPVTDPMGGVNSRSLAAHDNARENRFKK